MNDLADVNMDGVKPAGEFKDLDIGKYLVRIEDAGKKAVKDKFDANGAPHPDNGKNFMLALKVKVYGGPEDGHEEIEHLNLWNSNADAVRIAKATLASIQQATAVYSPASKDFIGKWMILEVYLNRNNRNSKKWEAAPPSMIPTDVPPPAPSEYHQQHAAAVVGNSQPAHTQHYQAPAHTQSAAAAGSVSGQLPSWATRK